MTHGGANSVMESMYFGVPMLGFPSMDEQRHVIRKVSKVGAVKLADVTST